MTVSKFEKVLPLLKIGKADREYFLKWLKRYGGWARRNRNCHQDEDLPSATEDVIEFCRDLLRSKTPAWQRRQAVRAIEAYRDSILQTQEPCYKEIINTLGQLASSACCVALVLVFLDYWSVKDSFSGSGRGNQSSGTVGEGTRSLVHYVVFGF